MRINIVFVFERLYFRYYILYFTKNDMKSKIFSTIVISSILVFALIAAAIPTTTTSVSAIVYEGLIGEHQGGNKSQSQDQSESISMLE